MSNTMKDVARFDHLELELGQPGCAGPVTLVSTLCFADIQFTYSAGEPAKLSGPMEDAAEAVPSELEIASIILRGPTVFDALHEPAAALLGLCLIAHKGVDLLPLLTPAQVAQLEDCFLNTGEWVLTAFSGA